MQGGTAVYVHTPVLGAGLGAMCACWPRCSSLGQARKMASIACVCVPLVCGATGVLNPLAWALVHAGWCPAGGPKACKLRLCWCGVVGGALGTSTGTSRGERGALIVEPKLNVQAEVVWAH